MNKVVLITGATGGLGPAVVKAFLEERARIIITYTSQKKFEHLTGEPDATEQITGIQADLTHEAEVKRVFEKINEEFGTLDILCHITGGFWMGGDISETSLDDWNKMMNLNLLSTFLCARQAFGIMKEKKGGHIITISARNALKLPPGMGAYAISKAGVLALSELLAKEGKDSNVKVNTILPSTIDTKANRQSMSKADFEKWVKPETIARAIISLVDGGMSETSGTAIKMYGQV